MAYNDNLFGFDTLLIGGLLLIIFRFILFHRKGILLEVVQRSDFSTDKFREIQSKIETTVQNLRPQDEYKEFIEKYK